jgi:murein DD-endopeptidase MepM/ murein hydrolase activator NlpD
VNYSNYLNRDYKKHDAKASKTGPRLQRKHLHLLAIFSVVVGVAALLSPTHKAEATRQIAESDIPSASRSLHEEILDLPLPPPAYQNTQQIVNSQPEEDQPWQAVTIHSGDNLSRIFDKLELSPQQLLAVVEADKDQQLVTALRPNKQLHFQIKDHQLQAIKYPVSPEKTLMVTRQGEGFNSHLIQHPVEIRLTHASGEIENSLYQSGHDAGLSDNIIMGMANIFGWDVDFALDIRKGDKFSLLYEQQYLDGEKLRDGRILAAEFSNRGKTYRAVLYTDPTGDSQYFSPDGRSMRKAFLRSPVDFRRISSRFQPERYHPILGKKRPHQGVDYAAASGTPIKAAGDGKVIFRGRKGGYGNTVILRHGNHITTLYGHMSKFRRGVSSGSRVKQGQIIGYVGMTGLATGPHLHYEFRINGVHRNPLTVKLPDAQPIAAKYKADFMQQSHQLLAQLDVFKRTQLAKADTQ